MNVLENSPLSTIYLPVVLSYKDIAGILQQRFEGKSFEVEGYDIVLNDIKLRSEGMLAVLSANVTGSFEGILHLQGKPGYAPNLKLIFLQDPDLKLETRNILVKGAGWLFQNKLEKQLRQKLRISTDEFLPQLMAMLNEQIEKVDIPPPFKLLGRMTTLEIPQLGFAEGEVALLVKAEGQLGVNGET